MVEHRCRNPGGAPLRAGKADTKRTKPDKCEENQALLARRIGYAPKKQRENAGHQGGGLEARVEIQGNARAAGHWQP